MSESRERYLVLRTNVTPDMPFERLCRHGITFTALRCDLRGGAKLLLTCSVQPKQIAEAMADAIGYHAAVIRPLIQRHGFAGYNSVRIHIEGPSSDATSD